MQTKQKMIVLEFNELSPTLMDRFISQGALPHFKKLKEQSKVYISDAQEDQENLEPWIQWVTVHTGLSFAEHGIFDLGDGHKLSARSIWDVTNAKGSKSFVCGSMNAKYSLPFHGAVIPDPWDTKAEAFPKELNDFYHFVRTNVQEHTNESVPLTKADYLRFLTFMLSNGLSLKTIKAIVAQVFSQLQGKGHWKKAVLLDKLQFDVFKYHYKKMRPDFATLFLNSTAHYQHKYWRNMESEPFSLKPSAEEQAELKDAILFGYQQMDSIVGDVLKLSDKNTSIVLLSALGQQPYLEKEESGGKRFYRPKSFDDLLNFLGIENVAGVSPVMSEQFHVYFDTETDAQQAERVMQEYTLNGNPVFYVRREGANLFAGCQEFGVVAADAVLSNGTSSAAFFDIFYQADCLKSGMHHPDGIVWISSQDRQSEIFADKIPLTAVAGMLLEEMGIEKEALGQKKELAA